MFFFCLGALLFQCYVMPYRIPAANMREVVLLTCLSLASGFEMLRISPVYNVGKAKCLVAPLDRHNYSHLFDVGVPRI